MVRYNKKTGCLEVRVNKDKWKNYWLVTPNSYSGHITMKTVFFPKEWVGKRVKLIVQEVEPEGRMPDNL